MLDTPFLLSLLHFSKTFLCLNDDRHLLCCRTDPLVARVALRDVNALSFLYLLWFCWYSKTEQLGESGVKRRRSLHFAVFVQVDFLCGDSRATLLYVCCVLAGSTHERMGGHTNGRTDASPYSSYPWIWRDIFPLRLLLIFHPSFSFFFSRFARWRCVDVTYVVIVLSFEEKAPDKSGAGYISA